MLGLKEYNGGKVVTERRSVRSPFPKRRDPGGRKFTFSQDDRRNLFRDSQGRFRKEVTLSAIGPLATSGGPRSFVMINDPVAQQNFILHPEGKTAEKVGKPFGRMKGGMPGDSMAGGRATPSPGKQEQRRAEISRRKIWDANDRGVSAQGTRYTRIIPAGQIGNEKTDHHRFRALVLQ